MEPDHQRGRKFGAEFALDFMIWPTKDRKLGWFVEPTYGYFFNSEHEQTLGVSIGLRPPCSGETL